jgi:pimeloyl-ACP methyl ester carboxylesterase
MAARWIRSRAVAAVALLLAAGAGARAESASERELTISGADGTPIVGTLLLPARADGARVAALLLVQGSGPTDRDGNQRPAMVTDLLRALALAATEKGFATLRYDKRGMHANAKSLPPVEKFAEFFRWENFVGDARAAYLALTRLPEIDPARVVILGHSEGGMLALSVAAAEDARPAGLVLAGTPGRPLDVLLREQIEASLIRGGAAPAARMALMASLHATLEHIKQTGAVPDDVAPALRALFPAYLGPFLKSVFAADPAVLARNYRGPVLILQGERDLQVSATRDTPVLEAALRERAGGDQTLRVFPALSHNFKPAKDAADHAFGGPLPPEVSAALVEWLAARFAVQR